MRYSIVLADPAWHYNDRLDPTRTLPYGTMSMQQIAALPVKEICQPDAALFLWATMPQLEDVMTSRIFHDWGFKFKTCAFVWVKLNHKAGTPFWGMGNWTRQNVELCLLGVRGKIQRQNKGVHQLIFAAETETLLAPRLRNKNKGEHSKKPKEVRERIVELLGDVPRVELFARERSVGWDAFGNQVAGSITLSEAASKKLF